MPLPAAMPAKTPPGRTRRAGLRPPTLAERFSARHNALGVLRLGLASAVIVGHARPLGGFDKDQFGHELTAGQTNIGALAVYGFFVLSGFLITGSGLRFPLGRYAWHRFLRIFPGLWACLLVTAFVIAPLVALYERGNLDGFWHHPQGPVSYVTANLFPAWQRSTISGLLSETPLGQALGGRPTSFDTSLWTLRYELACYALVGALLATRVLRRAPRAVVLLAALCWLVLLRDTLDASALTAGLRNRGSLGPFPVIGQFSVHQLLCLGFLFLLGASARLYRHRIPMHGALAALAGGVLAVSLWQGGFFVLGLPAYAYLLFYLAVALPGPFRRIGRARDYSYGIYIYGWPVQQVIALVGGARYGLPVYVLLSVLGTLALAVPSWHLVERPAMRLKDRPLPAALRRARRPAAPRRLVWSTTTVPLPASAREHAARRAARRELADSPAAGHASPAKTT